MGLLRWEGPSKAVIQGLGERDAWREEVLPSKPWGAGAMGYRAYSLGAVICSESADSRKPSSMEVSMTRISVGKLLLSRGMPPPARAMNHSLRAGVGFPTS